MYLKLNISDIKCIYITSIAFRIIIILGNFMVFGWGFFPLPTN